ncbi:MAG TPA: isoprenoid biosynthesis protein ElbB, partial [Candidatus Marinimicrobia bacterium]|nr:isoprenoid biosynthesis protein ElbB [Candidatus Neomarinimicrobiota bacterium]
MPKVGVVLSGCGAQDGAEIHESVITLLALDRAGAEVTIMA